MYMPYGIQQMQQQIEEKQAMKCWVIIYSIKLGDYILPANFILLV